MKHPHPMTAAMPHTLARAALTLATLCLTALTLTACGAPTQRSYYTLTYPIQDGRFTDPRPVTIRVKEVDIRESYRRSELAFRPDRHELQYYTSRRWSERPQKMITALVTDQLRQSNLVRQVDEALGQTPPDYTLTGEVEAIEQVIGGDLAYARLAMNWRLIRYADDVVVWTYRFDRRRPVGPADGAATRGTVRAMSEILQRSFDAALDDLALYLQDPETPRLANNQPPPVVPGTEATPDPIADVIRYDAESDLNDLVGLGQDDTPMGIGFGAVFVPSLSNSDREPLVAVYPPDGSGVIAEGRPGKRIVLPPGFYEVRHGAGGVEQQHSARVEVEEGRTTIIPPTWAALQVDVVDEQFVPFRGTYELIRMDTREDYGVGFGADEQQGERPRVWVLPPGLYKIIRAGGTYRDRVDFATVRLTAGEMTRFILVQDPDTEEFQGAGEVDPGATVAKDQAWTIRGVIGASLVFNQSDQVGVQEGETYGGSLFFDGAAIYRKDKNLWHTRLELEEEQTQAPEDDNFVNEADRLYFHTIYTYVVVPWFGPYARLGLETSLLDRDQAFEETADRQVLDTDGNVIRTLPDTDRVKLGGTFAPLRLFEGAGGNFRVLRRRNVELDLRLGIGARQTWANDLISYSTDSGTFTAVEDSYITGVEGAVVGFVRLERWITFSTEFDGLMAFDRQDSTFTWRNQLNLRLASFISLALRYNMAFEPTLTESGDDLRTEKDVQLRFSYTLF